MPNEEVEMTAAKKPRAKKEPTFEEMLTRLGEIADALENGSPTLTDALALYEEGASLLGKCSVMLERAEAKIESLQ